MNKDEVVKVKEEVPEMNEMRKLYDLKYQAKVDMNSIEFQMREFKRKDEKRKENEWKNSGSYTIDDEGEKKYNKQWLALRKRGELIALVDKRIGELRREEQKKFAYMFHAISKQRLDRDTYKTLENEALQHVEQYH